MCLTFLSRLWTPIHEYLHAGRPQVRCKPVIDRICFAWGEKGDLLPKFVLHNLKKFRFIAPLTFPSSDPSHLRLSIKRRATTCALLSAFPAYQRQIISATDQQASSPPGRARLPSRTPSTHCFFWKRNVRRYLFGLVFLEWLLRSFGYWYYQEIGFMQRRMWNHVLASLGATPAGDGWSLILYFGVLGAYTPGIH